MGERTFERAVLGGRRGWAAGWESNRVGSGSREGWTSFFVPASSPPSLGEDQMGVDWLVPSCATLQVG